MKRPWHISRRTFLRGLGTTMGLPVLEAMLPARATAQTMASPRRILAYYVPNGIHMAAWTPSDEGANYTLTPILQPLANVKDDVLVITGISNDPARPDGPGDHAAGTGSFLSCTHVKKTEGRDIQNGISMDQVAANAIGGNTRFPSLQLGSEGGASTGGCDSGYSCAYSRNISWAGPATPLAKETSAQSVFDRLFQGSDPGQTAEARRKRTLYKQSVLDFVKEDISGLNGKLGATDKRKLDEYLTGVRELEKRLEPDPASMQCNSGTRPERTSDHTKTVRDMSDVMVLAMQCDLTRVITYMLANAGSNRVYRHLGISEGHHQISHHQNNPDQHRRLQQIGTWEIAQFAYLLEKMKAIQEPDGTLLDNTAVFWSSEIEDGNSHAHRNLPVLVAGKGGGALNPGRHVRVTGRPPMANLFITLLSTVGVNLTTFGDDGTGPMAGLG